MNAGIVAPIAFFATWSMASLSAADPIAPIPIAAVRRGAPVSFAGDILPLLRKNCLACHNSQDAENGLSLETADAIHRGSADGPVIVPGKGAESRLLRLAARQEQPIMPPADNKVGAMPLAPEQLGLFKLWIDQGARGEAAEVRRVIDRHALPTGLQPILALAITPDDEYVACSRGDRLFVYHLPRMTLAAELTDPSITSRHAAHDDVIHSLAFDRSGDLLAVGGFRTVKIWRRPRSQFEREVAAAGAEQRESPAVIAVASDGGRLARGTQTGAIEVCNLGQNRPAITLVGYQGAVVGLAFSNDGARLYSAGSDKTLRFWNVADAKEIARHSAAAGARALALLPGGTLLATADSDLVIRIWSIAAIEQSMPGGNAPTPFRELKGHAKPATCLAAVSAERLLSADEDGRLRLWNTATGETLRELDHGAPVNALAVRPDGERFASAGANGVVRLWNAGDGSLATEIKSDPRKTRALSRADAALHYAKACVEYRKQELREAEEQLKRESGVVEGANKAREQAQKILAEKTGPAEKATAAQAAAEEAMKPAAEAFASARQAQSAAQAAADEAGKAVSRTVDDLDKAREAAAQDKQNNVAAAARDNAEKLLAEAKAKEQAADAELQKATLALREAQRKHDQAKQAARRAADQAKQPIRQLEEAKSALQGAINFIATANAVFERAKAAVPVAQQKVADAEALAARREMEKKTLAEAGGTPKPLRAVAFLADSSRLAVASEDTGLVLYDVENGAPLEILQSPFQIADLVAAAEGRLVASASNGRISIIKMTDHWTLERIVGRADDPDQLVDRVLSLDFSPDGTLLATGGGLPARAGELKLWNVATGRESGDIAAAHRDTIYGVRFSPDGQYLATASADRLAKIFRVADRSLVRTLEGHTHHVLGVAWSADGRLLATASGDQTVKLWGFDNPTPMRTMRGDAYRIGPYKREVTSIAFVADTEHIVASSGDGTVRLHRTSSDRDLRAVRENTGCIHAAVVTSDGRLVFGGGRDGVLHVWNGESGYKVTELKPAP